MSAFVVRLVEQSAVTFAIGFLTALSLAGANWTADVVMACVMAGGRAVYGMLARRYGDPSQPSMK